jgi:prepilin-type N-terminal cleavage/methylation domain-containing protein
MLRNKKGFTLLETIAALTILSGGILMLIQMFSGSLNQAAQAERYLNGVYLAQQKISQMEIDNFQSGTSEGTFEDQEGYRWQLEVLPYESPLNDEEARIKLEKVSLRVYWKDNNQEKEVQLVSLKILGENHTAPLKQLDPLAKPGSSTPKPKKPKTSSTSSKSSSKDDDDDFDFDFDFDDDDFDDDDFDDDDFDFGDDDFDFDDDDFDFDDDSEDA